MDDIHWLNKKICLCESWMMIETAKCIGSCLLLIIKGVFVFSEMRSRCHIWFQGSELIHVFSMLNSSRIDYNLLNISKYCWYFINSMGVLLFFFHFLIHCFSLMCSAPRCQSAVSVGFLDHFTSPTTFHWHVNYRFSGFYTQIKQFYTSKAFRLLVYFANAWKAP